MYQTFPLASYKVNDEKKVYKTYHDYKHKSLSLRTLYSKLTLFFVLFNCHLSSIASKTVKLTRKHL